MADSEDITVLDTPMGTIEDWEEGLTPVQRFEKLVQYGQVAKLLHNSFFQSLDKAGQVNALTQAVENMIHQLDTMAENLMKFSTTHAEGVKINRIAVTLARVKIKIMEDFAKGIDVVAQLSESASGKRYF